MTRFLLCRSKSQGYNVNKVAELLFELENDPWFCDKYELAFEHNGVMGYKTPDGIKKYPIWEMKDGSALELKKLAETNEMVFICNTVGNVTIASKHSPESLRRRLREMWEVVQHYGGAGTGQCKFIIYGFYQLQLMYCMGMSGGAFHTDAVVDANRVVIQLGGVRKVYDRDQSEHYSKLLGIPERFALRVDDINLRIFQMTPDYMKKFYENLDRVGSGSVFAKSIKEVEAEIGKNYWVSTMRSEYLTWKPSANIWETYGDKRACDHCSVAFSCRYYKRGAVCTLPGSEGRTLASLFGSRESKDVIEGIGKILEFQASRFEEAAEAEYEARSKAKEEGKDPPKLDPEITKLSNDIQRNAKSYAMLLNPNLLKPQVQIGIVSGQVQISQPEVTPQIMAGAARELEAAGYDREQITPGMVYEHIAKSSGGQIIEGNVVDGVKRDF